MEISRNNLFPVFLKTEQLRFLIVGGGVVADEKLHFLLKSSPFAQVKLVAEEVSERISSNKSYNTIEIHKKKFDEKDLEEIDIVIVATNNKTINEFIRVSSKKKGLLVNVADTPELCDFYLGSIVTKGDLKIAISTNGKSPTFAKRFRMLLEDSLPESIPEILKNLRTIRNSLKGDFKNKVDQLNEITSVLVGKN